MPPLSEASNSSTPMKGCVDAGPLTTEYLTSLRGEVGVVSKESSHKLAGYRNVRSRKSLCLSATCRKGIGEGEDCLRERILLRLRNLTNEGDEQWPLS